MPPQTRQAVYLKARQASISLNEWINQASEAYLVKDTAD